ncbi:50S ribosomal protein L25 [Terrisporobacter sp.]
MQNLVFNIAERNEKGKKVRIKGEVPCIIYGESLDKSISCKISKKEMLKLLSCPKNSVLSLDLDGTLEKCVLKEVQRNTFGEIIHLDFQYVRKGDTIKLKVPVNYTGQGFLESKGLLVESIISEIQLQGYPEEIPESIKVDVSELNYGDEVFAKSFAIPKTLKSDITDDTIVARVVALVSELQQQEVESSEL